MTAAEVLPLADVRVIELGQLLAGLTGATPAAAGERHGGECAKVPVL